MPDAVLLAPLVLVVALVVAGAAKVGRHEALAVTAEELGVPLGPGLAACLPWLEVVIGLALLLSGPGFTVAAVLAALLLAAYTALVLRVVLSDREVDCDCFGGLGATRLSWAAAMRNVLLLAAAVLAVADAVAGHSLIGRLGGLDANGVAWVVGAGVVAVVVAVVVGRPGSTVQPAALEVDRRGIPYLHVQTDDGESISLPELASLRPQLLVTLSTSCSACAKVSAVIGSWPGQVPELDVRVLTVAPPGRPTPALWPRGVLHDPDDRVAAVLGMVRPSAVLLGADALVAGGPVHGSSAVLGFYEEVRDALEGARG